VRTVKRRDEDQSLGISGWAKAPTIQAPIKSTAIAAEGENSIGIKSFVKCSVTIYYEAWVVLQPKLIAPESSRRPNFKAVASSIRSKRFCWDATQSISCSVITPELSDSRKTSPTVMAFM